MKNNTAKRIGMLGAGIVGGGLLIGLWLHNRKPIETSAPTDVPSAAPTASASMKPVQAVADSDYRAVFAGIYSSDWLPLETTPAEDELFCDASYCERYLACLISAGDLEWGTFLAESGLNTASKRLFLELTAEKKLALKQAAIASRGLGPDAGPNGRKDFLQSVSVEYDLRIKAEVGEKLFSAYQAYEREGVATLLEPFFVEAGALGFALSAEQEKNLTTKVAASPRIKTRTPREVTNAFLAFDAAADESVLLSLDQVMALREYQGALRNARKSSPPSVATTRSNLPESTLVIRQWSIGNFSKKAAKALTLETAKLDALKIVFEAYLLAARITSDEFARAVTTLIGAEGFQKLVALAEQSAVERDLRSLDRKLRIAGLSLNEAQMQKLRVVLDSSRVRRESSNDAAKLSLDFLSEDMRPVVERYQRARQAML